MTKQAFLSIIFISAIQITHAQCCKRDKNGTRQGYWLEADMQQEKQFEIVPYNYAIGKYINNRKSDTWYYYDTSGLLVQSEYYYTSDTVLIKRYHPNNKIKAEGKAYLFDDNHKDLVLDPITQEFDTVKLISPPTKTKCGVWKHYSITGKLDKTYTY